MTLSRGAIGNLVNRYRAVLRKCRMMNVFGSRETRGLPARRNYQATFLRYLYQEIPEILLGLGI